MILYNFTGRQPRLIRRNLLPYRDLFRVLKELRHRHPALVTRDRQFANLLRFLMAPVRLSYPVLRAATLDRHKFAIEHVPDIEDLQQG